MTALATQWLWWILATFGIAGIVAFWFLAPAAAQLALQIVVKTFKLVLSYRIGCALLAALVTGLIVDQRRHSYDDEQYAQRTAEFEVAQEARDKRIEAETRLKVTAELATATVENTATDTSVKEFTDAPPSPVATGNPLAISDADADKLCRIAGQVKCRPSSDSAVPTARRSGGRAANKGFGLPRFISRSPRATAKSK